MNPDWLNALWGGIVIGISVSLMLLLSGRVTGISGIINGALVPRKGDTAWRVFFVLGLFFGGIILKLFMPDAFSGSLPTGMGTTIVAGLLVGFGTIMGSGCTSGHGVCGISRLSVRSIVATVSFIAAGAVAVLLFRSLGVLP